VFQLTFHPAPAPLPHTIASAAFAHQQLPLPSVDRWTDTFQCHFDECPQQLPGGLVSLVSSHEGPLRALLLTIPNYVVREPALTAIFSELAAVLPLHTHFVILTHEGAAATVERWFARRDHGECGECRIITVPDEVEFTMWAEDPYACGVDVAGRTALIEPEEFVRNADNLIASLVGPEARLGRLGSPLIFQGGNVLVGDTFYLVGADYLFDSFQTVGDRRNFIGKGGVITAEIEHQIQRDFLDSTRQAHFVGLDEPLAGGPRTNVKCLPIGPYGSTVKVFENIYRGGRGRARQPVFHIDIFITLAGREDDGRFRILVGDPSLAAHTLGMELPDHARPQAFDELAEKLARHDEFAVTRNPLPYIFGDWHDDVHDVYTRDWYYATANNAIVENRDAEHRRVWLPAYGYDPWQALEKTDALNREIWEGLGFEVTMMPNCQALAVNLGALHCIKKYLAR
jgi:hypothetical protein